MTILTRHTGAVREGAHRVETRDGMCIEWNAPVAMDDGNVLRCDIFRPVTPGKFPILLTYGPYAKSLSFQEGYPTAWKKMVQEHPDVPRDSSNLYQNWEVTDPEKWVPQGYVCIRVDSRGCGCSPGYIDPFSAREQKDFAACIEWAGTRPWSNGKVGLNGVSYFGSNQWHVAKHKPKHLAAMCVWEGAADCYRETTHHGGIRSTFWQNWYDMQVKTVQYGFGERGRRSKVHGELVCGPEVLSDEALAANRCDLPADIANHPLDDAYHRERSAVWSETHVPFISAANWGGQGLHTRGNFEAFTNAASTQKWLEVHGLEHWTHFYTDYGREMQLRFFDHFLKDVDNGWDKTPPVLLQVRQVDGSFVARHEHEWPLARTVWTKLYLDLDTGTLNATAGTTASSQAFDATGDGLTYLTPPLSTQIEVTGPLAAKLFVSSSTPDADLFMVVRVFAPDMKEVVFSGAIDPHTPVAQGWLRASHRKLDPTQSRPYRPYHAHDEVQPLEPGNPVEVDVEIWPSSVVIPAGFRIGVTVRGRDYVYPGGDGGKMSNFKNILTGCGPFLHDDSVNRPSDVFGGITTLHSSADKTPYLLVPIVP